MALLEEQFTETLDAGAPDITYQGNEGQEQKIARELWDQLPPEAQQQFGNFQQFFSSGAWKQVLQMLQQQMQQQAPQQMAQQPQQPQQGLGSMMPAQMAYGGVAGPDGRRAYGWGSKLKKAFKKVTKPFKKIVKSPIGKAAAVYGLGTLAGGSPWFTGGGWDISKGSALNLFKPGQWSQSNPLSALVRKGLTKEEDGKQVFDKWGGASLAKVLGGAATLAPFAIAGAGKWDTGEQAIDKITGGDWDFDYASMRKELADAALTGDQDKVDVVLAKYNLSSGDMPGQEYWKTAAEGGRIGYFAGGPLVKKGIDALRKFKRPIYSFDDEAKMITDLIETKKYTQDELMALEGDQIFEIYVREGFTPPKAIPQVDETIEMKKIIPEIEKAQGGRIGYAEGGWEAGEKQDLISKLVEMGLPLPQAMKMAEMIMENATPEELRRTLSGTRHQGLTPEESIKFQENIITPDEDIDLTGQVSRVFPLDPRVQAQPVRRNINQALMGRMQQAPEEFMDSIRDPRDPSAFMDSLRDPRASEETPFPEITPYGAAEGGLMSLGGNEMDLRGGGFVPIGAKEKADDVPARLSKNEFVFTADAVRAAGDGDVDAGADKMYNTMKQLENRVGS